MLLSDDDLLNKAKELAIGRIFRLLSRPHQEGDVADYEQCRQLIMTDAPEFVDRRPNWVAQRRSGAQGD